MADSGGSEFRIRNGLNKINKCLESFNHDTPIEKMVALLDDMKGVKSMHRTLVERFNAIAKTAQEYADTIAAIEKALTASTRLIEARQEELYEYRRYIASRVTADPEVRKRIFTRDGYKCRACGTDKFLSIDHIIPVLENGSNDDLNLQCLCIKCNSSKGATITQ